MVTSKKEMKRLLGEINASGEPGQFFVRTPEGMEGWVVFHTDVCKPAEQCMVIQESPEEGVRHWPLDSGETN